MKIISKFKDYYDSASAWRDESILYIRKTSGPSKIKNVDTKYRRKDCEYCSRELEKALASALIIIERMPRCSFAQSIVIGFCGRAYPGYKVPNIYGGYTFFSFEKMKSTLLSQDKSTERDDCLRSLDNNDMKWGFWSRSPRLNKKSWEKFLETTNLNWIGIEPFLLSEAPVFLILDSVLNHHETLIVNPNLKDYNFASQVDPYTAFQDIGMFIDTHLTTRMDCDIERTDELIRDQKGFDKWSFRKPGKKGMK